MTDGGVFCSDCGEVLLDGDVAACPKCGSPRRTFPKRYDVGLSLSSRATLSMREYLSSLQRALAGRGRGQARARHGINPTPPARAPPRQSDFGWCDPP